MNNSLEPRSAFTVNEAIILNYIKEQPYCDLDSISFGIGISKNHVSRIIHRFEDLEIIEWSQDPNSPIQGTHQSDSTIWGWVISGTTKQKIGDKA